MLTISKKDDVCSASRRREKDEVRLCLQFMRDGKNARPSTRQKESKVEIGDDNAFFHPTQQRSSALAKITRPIQGAPITYCGGPHFAVRARCAYSRNVRHVEKEERVFLVVRSRRCFTRGLSRVWRAIVALTNFYRGHPYRGKGPARKRKAQEGVHVVIVVAYVPSFHRRASSCAMPRQLGGFNSGPKVQRCLENESTLEMEIHRPAEQFAVVQLHGAWRQAKPSRVSSFPSA